MHRGTLLIRNTPPVGHYSRPMIILWEGGVLMSEVPLKLPQDVLVWKGAFLPVFRMKKKYRKLVIASPHASSSRNSPQCFVCRFYIHRQILHRMCLPLRSLHRKNMHASVCMFAARNVSTPRHRAHRRSPRIRRASCMSLGMIVTRFAWLPSSTRSVSTCALLISRSGRGDSFALRRSQDSFNGVLMPSLWATG